MPFSIAIKRMSEILLYKANQCLRNLDRAVDNVHSEQEQLDSNVDRILDEVNASFQVLARVSTSALRAILFAQTCRICHNCSMLAAVS